MTKLHSSVNIYSPCSSQCVLWPSKDSKHSGSHTMPFLAPYLSYFHCPCPNPPIHLRRQAQTSDPPGVRGRRCTGLVFLVQRRRSVKSIHQAELLNDSLRHELSGSTVCSARHHVGRQLNEQRAAILGQQHCSRSSPISPESDWIHSRQT